MLEQSKFYFGANSCSFTAISGDKTNPSLGEYYTSDFSKAACKQYFEHFYEIAPGKDVLLDRWAKYAVSCTTTSERIGETNTFIKSDFYQQFFRKHNIHSELTLAIRSNEANYGTFTFYRNANTEVFTVEDHAKAMLYGSQLACGLALLRAKEEKHNKESIITQLMDKASIVGFFTVDKNGKVFLSSPGLAEKVPCLDGVDPNQFWHALRARLPQNVQVFCSDIMCGHTDQRKPNMIELDEDQERGLPPIVIVAEPDYGFSKKRISVFILQNRGKRGLSQTKIELFGFTIRQKEALQYVQLGLSNTQIAHEMNISVKTLEKHLTLIYQKTKTHNKQSLLHTVRP